MKSAAVCVSEVEHRRETLSSKETGNIDLNKKKTLIPDTSHILNDTC